MKELLKRKGQKCRALENEVNKIKDEIYTILLNSPQLWHTMDELKNYAGKDLSSIVIIEFDTKTGEIEFDFLSGDILKVELNNKLYFSDYEQGIIQWDEKKLMYQKFYYGKVTPLEILGFINLKTDWSEEDEYIIY